MSTLCCVTFHPLCELTEYSVFGVAPGPTSTVGTPAAGPGICPALFSHGQQRRSTEVRSQDCSRCAPGLAVGAVEAAQTLAGPSPHVYWPTTPTAAKARPIPATGAPVLRLVLPQALNLQSWQQRSKSVVHAAAGRDFSSARESHSPWGSAVVSATPLHVGHPLALLLGMPRWPGHTSLSRREGARVAAVARKPAQAVASAWGRRPQWQPHPSLRTPLNIGALVLWRPRLLLRTLLLGALPAPAPSGCLHAASSSPLPGSVL